MSPNPINSYGLGPWMSPSQTINSRLVVSKAIELQTLGRGRRRRRGGLRNRRSPSGRSAGIDTVLQTEAQSAGIDTVRVVAAATI